MSERVILIKHNPTGEVRSYTDRLWSEDGGRFMWEIGNYSCDCNRHLFFTNHDGTDVPCGDDVLYSVSFSGE